MDPQVLDDVIRRLLEVDKKSSWFSKKENLSESEIWQLSAAAREIFLQQRSLLRLEAPMAICGNIYGSYSDLLRVFKIGGFPPATNYLFLGDYVGYGKKSIETICLLLAYKIKYPDNFFLLKGRNERASSRLSHALNDCFNCLPVAALINEKIFCVNSGISPRLNNLQEIDNITRPTDGPPSRLLHDLLWSEPNVLHTRLSVQTTLSTFGPDKVSDFLQKHDLYLICCGNKGARNGYEFFADRQLVSIFSAPNIHSTYDVAGALLIIDARLVGSFKIFKWEGNKIKSNSSGSFTTIPANLVLRRKPLLSSENKDKDTCIGTSFDNDDNMKTRGERHGTTSQQQYSDRPFETPKVEVFECSTIGLSESSYIKQAGDESAHEDHLDNTESPHHHHATSSEDKGVESTTRRQTSNEISSFTIFSKHDIQVATESLSETLKIGQGGYGTVYRGFLRGTEAAIKVLDANSQQGEKEFLQEVLP